MPKFNKETNLNSGLPEKDGLDDVGREAILQRLRPRETNIVGNLADVQRGFGKVAVGEASNVEEGIELQPGQADDLKAEAKAREAADKALEKVNEELTTADTTDRAKDGSPIETMDTAKALEAQASRNAAKDVAEAQKGK